MADKTLPWTAIPLRSVAALVVSAAYAAHPDRFVHSPPTSPALPAAVWINAPSPTTLTVEARQ